MRISFLTFTWNLNEYFSKSTIDWENFVILNPYETTVLYSTCTNLYRNLLLSTKSKNTLNKN